MKEKKLLSMLLITLLVLSLAACAKNGGDPDNMSAEPANEKEAIEMYKTLMGRGTGDPRRKHRTLAKGLYGGGQGHGDGGRRKELRRVSS